MNKLTSSSNSDKLNSENIQKMKRVSDRLKFRNKSNILTYYFTLSQKKFLQTSLLQSKKKMNLSKFEHSFLNGF